LIKLFGVAATFRPITAKAQPSAVPIIGFLHAGSLAGSPSQVAGYRQGLKEAGFVEGQNLAIEYRWAEGHYERLPTLAADLVERKVAVLIAGGGDSPTKAAKAATKAIPIVFVTGTDPVKSGLVASLSRPGGSITGVSIILSTLMAKNLDLLHRLVPSAGVIGALVNPQYSDADVQFQEIQEAAHTVGLKIYLARASTESEVQSAFAAMVQQGVGALLVANDLFFTTHRKQIIDFAARNALPAIYYSGDFTTDGGLMSYSTSLRDAYQQAGHYTANILKGAKPSDLPVVQPTKFELVINLKTAKALGLDIPPTLLALADEVIE
jgi:putative ABC transport system substrate-binding protein